MDIKENIMTAVELGDQDEIIKVVDRTLIVNKHSNQYYGMYEEFTSDLSGLYLMPDEDIKNEILVIAIQHATISKLWRYVIDNKNANTITKGDFNILHYVSASFGPHNLEFVLKRMDVAIINKKNVFGETALHKMVKSGCYDRDMIKKMVVWGADPGIICNDKNCFDFSDEDNDIDDILSSYYTCGYVTKSAK